MQEYILKVEPQYAKKRLDLFLVDFSGQHKLGLSRTVIQRLIRQGKVNIPSINSLKPDYKIKTGDKIRICLPKEKENTLPPENIPLEIIYEDEDLAVINKAPGIVVHPAPGNYEHTLVNALLYHFRKLSDINPQRPGIVHRLDKETSGLLLIAKNNASHLNLVRQFTAHSIQRKYIALVKGEVEFNEQVIELAIGRHPYKRKNMSVGFTKDARYAKTYYRTLKRSKDFSLLELEPFTGRTHQLRVHLAHLGHPILGDTKYGKNNAFSRLALHAKTIGFNHPSTGKFMEFSCPLPQEFTKWIKSFDKNKT